MADPFLGAGLSVAGNLVSALGNASAARKKNGVLTQGTREQSRAGGEAAGVMGDFLTQLRGSRPNPAAEQGAFSAALGSGAVTGPATGSARFRSDAAGATGAARGYGGNLADLFARIRAPGLQRRNEAQLLSNMGNELRPIQQQSQDSDFLTQLRASMVKSNPWQQMLGQGLSQAGNYMVSNG